MSHHLSSLTISFSLPTLPSLEQVTFRDSEISCASHPFLGGWEGESKTVSWEIEGEYSGGDTVVMECILNLSLNEDQNEVTEDQLSIIRNSSLTISCLAQDQLISSLSPSLMGSISKVSFPSDGNEESSKFNEISELPTFLSSIQLQTNIQQTFLSIT